jgi:hypothetical protein
MRRKAEVDQPHAHHEHRGRQTGARIRSQSRSRTAAIASGDVLDRKAAKDGKMTKHGHFAEIASRRCFWQGVFTQPRPRTGHGQEQRHEDGPETFDSQLR